VKDLRISKSQDLNLIAGANSGFAMAGMVATILETSTSATILVSSRNSAETSMEFFTCQIDGKLLVGNFYKVSFIGGEKMEFVVTEIDGVYKVHGACSPQRSLIWTLPYHTRGSIAQRSSDIIRSIAISLCGSLGFLILMAWKFDLSEMGSGVYFNEIIISFVILLILNILVRRHFYEFSYEADKIFEVLGFSDPENVNLPKSHRCADIEYAKKTQSPRPQSVPWQFRYRSAGNDD
jgi:hypothetical protein